MDSNVLDQLVEAPPLIKKREVLAKKIDNALSSAVDAAKKREWVKMLNQMPDIREEKVEHALSSEANVNPERCFL